MIEQLQKVNNLSVRRYALTLPEKLSLNKEYPKAYLNHMLCWHGLEKVILHSTSKKLLTSPELYGPLNVAFSCIAGQTPKVLKSKQSVAAFKVMRGVFVGVSSHLRKAKMRAFCYKWSFVAAAADLRGAAHADAIGLKNVFVFELDLLDYKTFEPLGGLDIGFGIGHKSTSPSFASFAFAKAKVAKAKEAKEAKEAKVAKAGPKGLETPFALASGRV